jgi:predicted regulator of Ras-like GTPase activity (Roadblock/LC7/MglB family)
MFFPGLYPDQVIALPVFGFAALTVGEILLCLLLAFGCYPSATKTQQLIPIACTLVGLSMLFGTMGNVVCPVTHLMPGAPMLVTGLVVSWIQLAIMNIGGLVGTLTLYELVVLHGEEAEAAAALAGMDFSDRVRSTPADPSKALPADGLALSGPPANFFVSQGEDGTAVQDPAASGASTSATNLAGQRQDGRVTGNAPAVQPAGASATRLDSQKKKRLGSTSNKLQSLSASKGSIPVSPLLAEPGGLTSLLDRLDPEQTGSKFAVVEEPPPADTESTTEFTSAPAPEPAPVEATEEATPEIAIHSEPETPTVKGTDIGSRLMGAATSQNRIASVAPQDLLTTEMNKPVEAKPKSADTSSKLPPSGVKVDAKISAVEPVKAESRQTVESGSHQPTSASKGLTAELDAVKASKGPSGIGASIGKPSLGAPSRPGLISKFVGQGSAPGTEVPKGDQLEIESPLEAAAEAVAAETDTAESADSASNRIFAEGVDADVDDIFSNLAPEAAQRDFDPTLLNKEEPITEEALPAVAEVSEDVQPEEEAVNNLFGKKIDESVDDIFSTLAPVEAQRNFDPALFHKDESVVDEAPPAVAEPTAEVQLEEQSVSNLFGKRVDESVDDIFSTLAPEDAQREVSASSYARTAVPEAEEKTEPVAAAEQAEPVSEEKEGLFDEHVDEEIDDLFSQLAPPEAQRTVDVRGQEVVAEEEVEQSFELQEELQEVAQVEQLEAAEEPLQAQEVVAQEDFSPQTVPEELEEYVEEEADYDAEASEATVINPVTKNREVKEFGRLSARSVAPSGQSELGTMKTIGKLLLDVSAIENIIKSGEIGTIGSGLTNARIITERRGEGIQALLHKIDAYEGVSGSLIVGHDGLVIASTVSGGMDKDTLGALSTALLSTTNLATLKLDIGKLRQMVLLTEKSNGEGEESCATVLTDVEVGILAVFLKTQNLEKLDGLLESIHETIHG